jgi:hypothetical protein
MNLSDRVRVYLFRRKGIVIASLLLLVITAGTGLELIGVFNFVPVGEGENELVKIAPIMGAFGSLALSLGLLLLYATQTQVLEHQYRPYLTGEIKAAGPVIAHFSVRNSGSDFAYDINAEWSVGGETRTWQKSNLPPGESADFPVITDREGGWILNLNQLRSYFDENDIEPRFEYDIECEDRFGVERTFDGVVDLGILLNREEANEIWQPDPPQAMADSLENIENSLDSVASNFDDVRDDSEWKNRWSRDQAIIQIVEERGEVPVEVLSRILNTRVSSLEYRLSELEAAGYLRYSETTGLVKNGQSSGQNQQLTDYT